MYGLCMLASKCMHSLIYAPKSLTYRIISVVMISRGRRRGGGGGDGRCGEKRGRAGQGGRGCLAKGTLPVSVVQ